ncbi:MAG: hypothetical protein KDD10_25630, partial [Phaeodactylibacter sp.]|nr:hypothetical protein [Phaeodactylibacter sp.]
MNRSFIRWRFEPAGIAQQATNNKQQTTSNKQQTTIKATGQAARPGPDNYFFILNIQHRFSRG